MSARWDACGQRQGAVVWEWVEWDGVAPDVSVSLHLDPKGKWYLRCAALRALDGDDLLSSDDLDASKAEALRRVTARLEAVLAYLRTEAP